MSSHDHVFTAKSVQYQKVSSLARPTDCGLPEARGNIMSTMAPPKLINRSMNPPSAGYDTFKKAGIHDSAARYTSCTQQHTQPSYLAARIGDDDHQCPPYVDRYSMNDTQQWRPPQPIWAPAKFPEWPPSPSSSPSSSPPSPPPLNSPPPQELIPSAQLKNLRLYSTPGSPPPYSTPIETRQPQSFRKKSGRDTSRRDLHTSTLIAQLKWENAAQERAAAEARLKVKSDESNDLIAWGIFDKNFNFGPKSKGQEPGCLQSPSPPPNRFSLLPNSSDPM